MKQNLSPRLGWRQSKISFVGNNKVLKISLQLATKCCFFPLQVRVQSPQFFFVANNKVLKFSLQITTKCTKLFCTLTQALAVQISICIKLVYVSINKFINIYFFLISNILCRFVLNDLFNNLSMIVVTSLKSSGPCNKDIIEYDLEENI